jgi:hypothetical protein
MAKPVSVGGCFQTSDISGDVWNKAVSEIENWLSKIGHWQLATTSPTAQWPFTNFV